MDQDVVRTGDRDLLQQAVTRREALEVEIHKAIVGQDAVIEQLLISVFANGHSLFEGVPGLAKTLLVSTLSRVLSLSFNRVQFTPDLMPTDITGTEILQDDHNAGRRAFSFVKGPVFANLLLADEINRSPPKTQSALLQAMQEKQVTVGGRTYPLELPFMVFATQNPIEQEGTYPLPEAQLDRFMFLIEVGYPSTEHEVEIARQTTSAYHPDLRPVMGPDMIQELQQLVLRMPVAEPIARYAVRLVRATRPSDESAISMVKEFAAWGAGPRASQYLLLAGKARAMLQGRPTISEEDVRAVAPAILRHRIVLNFAANTNHVTSQSLVAELLKQIR